MVDLFGGSGTTAATAHKLGRRWIISERLVGTVAEVLLPRLEKVVAGVDGLGISESVSWAGGGAFEVLQVKPRLGQVHELRSVMAASAKALLTLEAG